MPAMPRDDLTILWDYLVDTDADAARPCDVVFCFGCRDLDVPRRAAQLFANGIAPWVLVSGGGSSPVGRHATEAGAFASVLCERGVPPDRVVLDHRASNTSENVSFGMAALTGRGVDVSSAALVTWPFSLRRSVATFARHFPGVRTYGHPARAHVRPDDAARARAVRYALGELQRLHTYSDLGHIEAQLIPRDVRDAASRLAADAHRHIDCTSPRSASMSRTSSIAV